MPLHLEEWRKIIEFPNYEVSNLGRVRRSKKVLKPMSHSNGYQYVDLSNGAHNQRAVHRLVLQTFFGESSLPSDHLNGNKADNRLVNLEYVTVSENRRRAQKLGLHPTKYQKAQNRKCCGKGHMWTPENTLWLSNGTRNCRACHRERERLRRQRCHVT